MHCAVVERRKAYKERERVCVCGQRERESGGGMSMMDKASLGACALQNEALQLVVQAASQQDDLESLVALSLVSPWLSRRSTSAPLAARMETIALWP
jgi:hypothetical protein